jgi:hypothetical protein
MATGRGGRRGLSKAGKTLSKSQQRYLFAKRSPLAHVAARSGPAYRALPTKVGR